MATIEVSQGLYTSYVGNLVGDFAVNYTGLLILPFNNQQPFRASLIRIMKGTVPTDFSTLVDANSRSSDVLMTFYRGDWGNPTNSISVAYENESNRININTPFINATASGTATWYWMISGELRSNPNITHQSFGTVGTLASGSDLEMSSTNIVSGQPYKINNLKIQFPTSWTY